MPHPSSKHRTAAAAALIAVLVAACGGGDDDQPSSANDDPTERDATEVAIELVAFQPETVEIETGQTVTWTQNDPGAHTVTSGTVEQDATGSARTSADGTFDSGDLTKGETFSFTFDEAGTYPYFCELHPATMRGEIQVG